MGKAAKFAEKNANRKAAKQVDTAVDDAPAGGVTSTGAFLELATELALGSVIVSFAPKLPIIFQKTNGEAKPSSKESTDEDETSDANEVAEITDGASMFTALQQRLFWQNPIGLSKPSTSEEATKSWLEMKSLEFDGGPRPKKKGNPGLERISANFFNHLPQYINVLLVLMILRAFFLRSFFACLPWLVGYQNLSLLLPLEALPQLPQVPLEKCPVKCRAATTLILHALVLLFFAYELLWRTYFFEKILIAGILLGHAYVMKPFNA